MRQTKIIATIGPATASPEKLDGLMEAGVDGIRLNFSHGSHDQHREHVRLIREAMARSGRPIALLADLQGPKIRVGTFPEGPVALVPGQPFTLEYDAGEAIPGTPSGAAMSYPLADDVEEGDELLLDDGLLKLRVTAVDPPRVVTEVVIGGRLSDRKGINIPGRNLSAPALTEKDRKDLEVAVELGVHYVALSFVRRPEDVYVCKTLAGKTKVIAKLEKPEAMDRVDAIIDAADGVMIARGDLGVEMGTEKVPTLQKQVIRKANDAGKLVITATQMLESMIQHARPTRAEAADVANAVLDGTDVVMLSGETAVGAHAVDAVRTMDLITREAEGSEMYLARPEASSSDAWDLPNACSRAAAAMSRSVNLKAILASTATGNTSGVLSHYRPRCPIVGIVSDEHLAGELSLQWGVVPCMMPKHWEWPHEEALEAAGTIAREAVGAGPGDTIVVLLGSARRIKRKSLTLRTLS